MSAVGEFIRKHNMHFDTIRLEALVEPYISEMEKGLAGGESSLPMIPSYITAGGHTLRDKKVVCVDAGGTNLRVTTACIDKDGVFRCEKIARHVMPAVDEWLSAQAFFDIFAERIAPYAADVRDISISFAFPTKTTPGIDCEIMKLSKELKVKGIEGRFLGREVGASLAKMGIAGCTIITLNDTVATALAGPAEHANEGFGAFTGTIIGTGSNSCYLESNANISKLPDLGREGTMMINTESSNFDKLPRSDIDVAFDQTTQHPGAAVAEKMLSGRYLGSLCHFTLRQAAKEGVFACHNSLEKLKYLRTAEASEFLESGGGILAKFLKNAQDAQNAKEIMMNIVRRGARVAALQMAAMAHKSVKKNNKLCMVMEGTTYEKMYGLKEELQSVLLPYLQNAGYEAKLTSMEHAVLKGCAVAGLSGNMEVARRANNT